MLKLGWVFVSELYQNATILVTFTDLPDIKDAKK